MICVATVNLFVKGIVERIKDALYYIRLCEDIQISEYILSYG